MRQAHSTQARFDCDSIPCIELNLQCRDEIIPILAALRHIYCQSELREEILRLVAEDVNADSRADRGREGMQYWQIVVLAAVRLGCNFDYDRLQDLAENHRKLRHMMGLGDWELENEQRSFDWRRIRDNLCLLKPETIDHISHLIVAEGHRLEPAAAKTARVDSFVIETDIHYPSESSLIWDGLRKILDLSALVAIDLELPGWRQHAHLRKKIKNLHSAIARAARSKSPKAKKQLKKLYQKLLKRTEKLLDRAEKLVREGLAVATTNLAILGRIDQIRIFIERTRQVAGTAYRRVICGEQVPNEEKLFSIFEPHTQLYRRGKAGQENQFGRLVMVYEGDAGFITHHYLMGRTEQDQDVAVPQTKLVQTRLGDAIETISFDRGYHSEENERELAELVSQPCLPKRGPKEYAEQMKTQTVRFREARQRHPGVESAIGALQAGNGLKRSRDRSELGMRRYLSLAILGRNLHVLGKLLIAAQSPSSHAAQSKRKAG